jgi:hypothetical protein
MCVSDYNEVLKLLLEFKLSNTVAYIRLKDGFFFIGTIKEVGKSFVRIEDIKKGAVVVSVDVIESLRRRDDD